MRSGWEHSLGTGDTTPGLASIRSILTPTAAGTVRAHCNAFLGNRLIRSVESSQCATQALDFVGRYDFAPGSPLRLHLLTVMQHLQMHQRTKRFSV